MDGIVGVAGLSVGEQSGAEPQQAGAPGQPGGGRRGASREANAVTKLSYNSLKKNFIGVSTIHRHRQYTN